MTMKRLDELNLQDAGIKARLEEMSGSLGGLFFEHVTVLNEGGGVVGHRVAVDIEDLRLGDDDTVDAPGAGRGATVDAAAHAAGEKLLAWVGERGRRVRMGRGLGEESLLATLWRDGDLLRRQRLERRPVERVVKCPWGGFRRAVLEGAGGGFSLDPWDEDVGR